MVPKRENTCGTEDTLAVCGADTIDDASISLEYFGDYAFHDHHMDGVETYCHDGMEHPVGSSEPSYDRGHEDGHDDRGHEDGHDENLGNEHLVTDGTSPESTMPAIGRENNHHLPNSPENHPISPLDPESVASNSRPDGVDIKIGDVFGSPEELTDKLTAAATRCGWQYTSKRRDATRMVFTCKDPGCNWRVATYKCKEDRYYTLKKYENFHTCSAMSLDLKHKNVTRKVLAKGLLDRFSDLTKIPTVKEVLAFSSGTMNSQCSRWKAYNTRNVAIDMLAGTREEIYGDLPAFFHMTAKLNPGTQWEVKKDENSRFEYCFFALGAQIRGISCMRPLVVLDFVRLKREPGQLVVATMVDSEECCYPIAWGALVSENNDSWTWFLQKVKGFLPDNDGLTFVSDQHASIEHAINTVYPEAFHVICYNHLRGNLGKLYPEGSWGRLFYKATYAYNVEECRSFLNEIEKLFTHKNSANDKTIVEYLMDDVGIERWARAFSRTTRFDILTSNHVESLHTLMGTARKLKLIPLFQTVIETMSKWFDERREAGDKMGTSLTDKREAIMEKNYDRAVKLQASHISNNLFQIRGDAKRDYRVDFDTRSCTCGRFQNDWQPCAHACACAAELKKTQGNVTEHKMAVMYKYTSDFYSVEKFREAYAKVIVPVPARNEWDREAIPLEVREDNPLPPEKSVCGKRSIDARTPPVRERNTAKRIYKCSKCNQTGHNRAKCPEIE